MPSSIEPNAPTVASGNSPNCVSQGAPPIPSSATLLDDAKVDVSFSHVQLYVDAIEQLAVYKRLEHDVNELVSQINPDDADAVVEDEDGGYKKLDVAKYRDLFRAIVAKSSSTKDSHADTENQPPEFVPQGRDVIKQLIAGLGFRITAHADVDGTKSVLLTTKDPNGVQIVVTALSGNANHDNHDNGFDKDADAQDVKYDHFDPANLARFFATHSGRQGIAVLAFEVTSGSIDTIQRQYAAMHPKLLIKTNNGDCKKNTNTLRSYEDEDGCIIKILEVYAYYQGEVRTSEADVGTVLRFVQRDGDDARTIPLPGFRPVEATFDSNCSQAAYCDHWVSNVHSRTGFLDTLNDVLGFVPKGK